MRVMVHPRQFAFSVTTFSTARACWSIAFAYLALAGLSLIDVARTNDGEGFWVPLGCVIAFLLVLALLTFRPSRLTGVVYLAVGAVCAFLFQSALLDLDPGLAKDGVYLLNRLPLVLILVGVVDRNLIAGILWSACGYLLGLAGTVAAFGLHSLPLNTGWGPILSLSVLIVLFGSFELIRLSQQRLVPDFGALEAETARIARSRELEERVTAIIHDTVLSDLASIAAAGDVLDQRARERFLRDVAFLTSDTVELPAMGPPGGASGSLYSDVLAVASDFRWRGLTVDVSGSASDAAVPAETHQELLWALRACLDNVARHAGTDSAEVFISDEDSAVTVMVVDKGCGFDPQSVPADRLGIRSSITRRIESSGGSVRIWSSPGAGTSIVFSVPQSSKMIPHA